MVTQKRKLLAALEELGWEVHQPDDLSLDWWADEVWLLTSSRPHDCQIYLAFVVDPQWDGPRKTGQGVWAVTASVKGPQQWSDLTLSLGRYWEDRLPQFLAALEAMRSQF